MSRRVNDLSARALRVSPGGAQTLSKRPDRYGAGMPGFLVRGEGPHVWDPDGTRYLDWIASLAAVTLGHTHHAVRAAMFRQLRCGGTFAMPHPLEVKIGERFLAATGWPDGMVRWVSTGSEATEAAVRVARSATGRAHVASVGYHSWYSTFTAAKPVRPGVPDALRSVITDVPDRDLDALAEVFASHGDDVAAVILEPCGDQAPDAQYLQAVVAMARDHGTLVISDEIIAGFRWSEQGAMLGTCGIRPDLATFGKTISNGAFPIAALVGPPDLMAHAWPVSGTYGGHPVGLAGVGAVLDVYQHDHPILALTLAGRSLRLGLQGLVDATPGLAALVRVRGDDPRPVIRVQTGEADLDTVGQTLLCQELARRGVLWHPAGAGNAMAVHGPHVRPTLEAFAGALPVVVEALMSETPARWLVGDPVNSALAVRPG